MVGNISFSGMATGLPPDLVDQLMKAQQTRLKALQKDRDFFSNQKTQFGELKTKMLALQSKLEEMQDATQFTPHTAGTSDNDKLGVSASSEALAATHTVTVQRLATHSTRMSGTGLTSNTATLSGATTFSFDYNGTTYNVALAAGDSLKNVAQKINATDFGDEKGVSASMLYDGTNYRLALTAKDAGAYVRDGTGATTTERISNLSGTLSFNNGQSLASGGFSLSTSGVDAELTVDGLSNIYSSENTVSDVIPGVTMSLRDTAAAAITLTINNDTDTLKSTLQGFVDSYNEIVDHISKNRTGVFSGETAVRGIVNKLREVLNTETDGVSGSFSLLAHLGIETTQSTGKLSINSDRMEATLESDFSAAAEIFTDEPTTGNQGIAFRMADLIDSLTDTSSGGVIEGKNTSLDSRLKMYDQRIERENSRLEKVRTRLTKQFAHLEQLTSSMNSTQSSLAAMLR
ncbi:MAG: flagellar filament capping protein FliD [Magnetococcales bacterium]|nr:flagellar filament capping protein FliD [Magnetococcales bacterium]